MPQPHKHAAIIKAWAHGAEIQYRSHGDIWYDYPKDGGPAFFEDWDYRIKPTVKRYRICKMKAGHLGQGRTMPYCVFDTHYGGFEKENGFICWVTDWLEYEDVSSTS